MHRACLGNSVGSDAHGAQVLTPNPQELSLCPHRCQRSGRSTPRRRKLLPGQRTPSERRGRSVLGATQLPRPRVGCAQGPRTEKPQTPAARGQARHPRRLVLHSFPPKTHSPPGWSQLRDILQNTCPVLLKRVQVTKDKASLRNRHSPEEAERHVGAGAGCWGAGQTLGKNRGNRNKERWGSSWLTGCDQHPTATQVWPRLARRCWGMPGPPPAFGAVPSPPKNQKGKRRGPNRAPAGGAQWGLAVSPGGRQPAGLPRGAPGRAVCFRISVFLRPLARKFRITPPLHCRGPHKVIL